MASTSYLCRVIYKEHSSSSTNFAGSYKLLMRAKSIQSPVGDPNLVESTTLEDDQQTYEMGIKQSDLKQITGNLDKSYLDELAAITPGTVYDIIHLYGIDGLGGVAKYAYTGQISVKVDDVGGVDEILGMTASIAQNSTPALMTDSLTVAAGSGGTFTVTV